MAVLTGPGSPRKTCPPTARSPARWRQDPEVRLMLRVRDGDAAAFTELERTYRHAGAGLVLPAAGRPQRGRGPDAGSVPASLPRPRQLPAARAFRHLGFPHHAERRAQRPAVAPPSALHAVWKRRRPNRASVETLLPDRAESPSRPLERDELAGVVRAAVAGLAGRQRAAVELHQFEDRTYTEVAAELDMTPKAAKSLLYRARNQLREVLATFVQ